MTRALTDPTPLISPQQAAWDRRKFEQRWKNSATPEEIEVERQKAAERTAQKQQKSESTRARRERLRAEEEVLIEAYAPLRANRIGFALPPGTRSAVRNLAAILDESGERKWSWNAIGRIVGISGVAAREIADAHYAAKRSAYREAA